MKQMTQMKVALFTDTYDEVNGVANTFRYLTEYCRKSGRQLDIYAHSENKDSVEEEGSVRVFRYKPAMPIDIYFDMIFDLKVPRFRIFKDARRRKYDLLHTATPGSMGLNALAVARLDKIPMVGSYHTTLPEYVRTRVDKIVETFNLPTEHSGQRSEGITWDYMEWYYNQTRLVLAPSEHTKSVLEGRFKVPVGIFSRGIDTERFNPRYRERHQEVVVLYVGRVSAEKNLDVLADVFSNYGDAKLMIVGDGPYRAEMQERCGDAVFTGFLKGEELSKAYARADIFVFPSTTDTFGNVVLEAMSSGVPVIVTDKMGPKELVRDGENGFVTHGDDDFREKLDILVKDKQRRELMGGNAREYAVSRSWDAVFERLFADYEAIADKK